MGTGSHRIEAAGVAAAASEAADAHRLWGEFVGAVWRQVPSVATAGVVATVAASGQSFVLAALLGPESFGSLVFLLATIDLVRSLVDPYLFDPTLRFAGEYDARGAGRHAYAVALIAGGVDFLLAVVFVLAIWAGGGLIATHILGTDVARGLMLLYAATALTRPVMTASRVIFSVDGRPDIPQWFECGEAVMRGVLCVSAVLLGHGITGVVVGYLAASVAVAAVAFPRAKRVADRRWGVTSGSAVREVMARDGRRFFRFGAVNNANFLLSLPSKQLDSIVVGMMCGPESVGFLRIAKSLAASVGLIVGPLQAVTYPRLVALRSSRPATFSRFVRSIAVRIGAPTGALAFTGILLVPAILPQLLGDAYQGAVVPTLFLLVGAAWWQSTFWVRPALLAADRPGVLAMMAAMTSLVAVLSLVLVVPHWGISGHALVFCIAQVVSQSAGGWIALRSSSPR